MIHIKAAGIREVNNMFVAAHTALEQDKKGGCRLQFIIGGFLFQFRHGINSLHQEQVWAKIEKFTYIRLTYSRIQNSLRNGHQEKSRRPDKRTPARLKTDPGKTSIQSRSRQDLSQRSRKRQAQHLSG